jgi:hypothetical protein
MLRSMASKVAWVGWTASMVFGLALVLALILGVGTMAAAAVPGDPFKLGRTNTKDHISTLVGSASGALLKVDNEGDGPALDLRVESGEAPMRVNSTTRVNDLNADQVDGKSAANIGVNGRRVVSDTSDIDSDSSKWAVAECPDANMAVLGTGYRLRGYDGVLSGKVVMVYLTTPNPYKGVNNEPTGEDTVGARAVEAQPYAGKWSVEVVAICAKEGTP